MQHKLDLSSKGPHRRENVTKHSICYERVTAMVTRAYDKGHVALRDSNYLGNVKRLVAVEVIRAHITSRALVKWDPAL